MLRLLCLDWPPCSIYPEQPLSLDKHSNYIPVNVIAKPIDHRVAKVQAYMEK